MLDTEQLLKVELSVQRKWCGRFAASAEQDALVSDLANPDMNPQWAANSLSSCEKHIRTRGVLDIFGGVVEPGWEKLHLAWQYSACRTKVNLDYFDQLASSTDVDSPSEFDFFDLSRTAWSLCEAIAFNERSFAEWCGNRLIASQSPEDLIFQPSWRDESAWRFLEDRDYPPLERFILTLFCMWNGGAPHKDYVNLGIYQPLIDNWSDPRIVNAMVSEICELRLSYVKKSRDQIVGYGIDPYHIYPIDIVAIARVRKDLGNSPVVADHPLLEGWLDTISSASARSPSDNLLRVVLNYCRQKMPNLEIPWDRDSKPH